MTINPQKNNRTIDWLRHGEPVGGRAFRGNRIDDPLSERGWQQMWHAVPSEMPWRHIVTSPMSRCHDFATALAAQHGVPLTVADGFKEVGFGDWEGRTASEIIADNADEYAAFYRDPVRNRPPGAEALDDFVKRVSRAYEELLQDIPASSILVITHAGVIRAIVTQVLGAPMSTMYRLKIANAGLTRILIDQYGSKLEMLNGQIANQIAP